MSTEITHVRFEVKIDSGNAAMVDNPSIAIAELLTAVADLIQCGQHEGILRDANGQKAGRWQLEVEQEEETIEY